MPSGRRRVSAWMSAGLLLSCLFGVAAGAAFGRAGPKPEPSFAIVPDPVADGSIAIEPTGTAPVIVMPRLPMAPPAPSRSLAALRVTPSTVSAPVLAEPPPVLVVVCFPDRPGARERADQVASLLRARGMPVEETAVGKPLARARIVFGFAEDHDAAASIDGALTTAYGIQSPMDLAPGSMNSHRPGTVQLMLPG